MDVTFSKLMMSGTSACLVTRGVATLSLHNYRATSSLEESEAHKSDALFAFNQRGDVPRRGSLWCAEILDGQQFFCSRFFSSDLSPKCFALIRAWGLENYTRRGEIAKWMLRVAA